jgi:hypothetical protein
LVLTAVVDTVKLTLLAPAGTVNDEGTVTFVLLELRATIIPPPGAADVRVTLQEDPAGGRTDVGLHKMPLKLGGCVIVTTLPLAEVGISVPAAAAAMLLVI